MTPRRQGAKGPECLCGPGAGAEGPHGERGFAARPRGSKCGPPISHPPECPGESHRVGAARSRSGQGGAGPPAALQASDERAGCWGGPAAGGRPPLAPRTRVPTPHPSLLELGFQPPPQKLWRPLCSAVSWVPLTHVGPFAVVPANHCEDGHVRWDIRGLGFPQKLERSGFGLS